MAKRKANKFIKMRQANAENCKKGTTASQKKLKQAIADYTKGAKANGKNARAIKQTVDKFTGCKRK